jgi:hypothetical protein
MAAWARPGATARVDFGQAVRLVDPLSGASAEADACALTSVPVLAVGVPERLVAEARTNRARPFPWHGGLDYTGATAVWATMGEPGEERGLHHIGANRSSTAVEAYGVLARDCGKGAGQAFSVAPGSLSYTTEPITITVVARRNAANDNAGFNLWYESTTGIRGTGEWYTIPGNDQWYTKTWTIADAQFVGKWGYNFLFNADTPRPYYLRSVTVSKAR